MEHLIPYIVLGSAAGILSGTLGVGSGVVLIPVLVLLFDVEQKSAQGMALAVMVPMALVGAIRYAQHPEINVDLRVVVILAAGAVVGALIGAHLATVLPGNVLRKLFAAFLILVAVRMFWPSGSQADRPATTGPAAACSASHREQSVRPNGQHEESSSDAEPAE